MEIRKFPPELGEHTAEVLREAGYTPGDIRALAQKNVVLVKKGEMADGISQ